MSSPKKKRKRRKRLKRIDSSTVKHPVRDCERCGGSGYFDTKRTFFRRGKEYNEGFAKCSCWRVPAGPKEIRLPARPGSVVVKLKATGLFDREDLDNDD